MPFKSRSWLKLKKVLETKIFTYMTLTWTKIVFGSMGFLILLITVFGVLFLRLPMHQRSNLDDFSLMSRGRLVDIEQRSNLLRQCKSYGLFKPITSVKNESLSHVLIDRKNKFLYCYVPKAGTTHWKRIMYLLAGKTNQTDLWQIPGDEVHNPNAFETLSNLPTEDKEVILKTYTKFLIARHPFERILSAYKNKFENLDDAFFRQNFDSVIIQNSRRHLPVEDVKKLHDVKFEELIEFILHPELTKMVYNDFWDSINNLCHPCTIKYDIIGKFGTIEADSNHILKMIGINHIKFPEETNLGHTRKFLKSYYRKLSSAVMEKLYKLFEIDLKLFGFRRLDLR